MNIFVLYDVAGIHSGRALGVGLQNKVGKTHQVSKGRPIRLEVLSRAGKKFDHILNLGWYKDFDPKGARVINPPDKIRRSSNKRSARISFSKLGIPAPRVWTAPGSVPEYEYPVIGRPDHHSKGSGFWFCKDSKQASKAAIAGASHFIKFIPNTREFRVHVMASGLVNESREYKIIKISEKVESASGTKSNIIKNHDNGWIFSYPADKNSAVVKAAREAAKKTIQAAELDWGAVDVVVSKDTEEAYVLEINSTPRLTDDQANTLEKYIDSFCSLLKLG